MRLYDDHLDIGGTSYPLMDLTEVHPIYYHIVGVSSARLELSFKQKRVVLRGIAATEKAQRTALYLSSFCRLQTPETEIPVVNKTRVEQPRWFTGVTKELRQRRMRRIQAERARREHGFDVEQLALRLQALTLPQVYVPTRLLTGECAHYCTDATVCEEPFSTTRQSSVYRVKDQGMLILTNRRMIYIGRRRQLVLDYSRLLHVSRLQGAIAVVGQNWAQRELFEVRFPLECTMYLDAILLRYRKEPENERTHARVRQLYPSTKTSSYDAYLHTTNTQSAALTQWRSSGLSHK
ncbi:MAG: hypothetical protein JO215_06870 [Ktedonobacteraceae bacterium]|nr:hypothetical protein [Ktedonobacteraceae bacterium]